MRNAVILAIVKAIGPACRTETQISDDLGPLTMHHMVLREYLNGLARRGVLERVGGTGGTWKLTSAGHAVNMGGESELEQQLGARPIVTPVGKPGEKTMLCKACNTDLPESSFRRNSAKGWCKACTTERRSGVAPSQASFPLPRAGAADPPGAPADAISRTPVHARVEIETRYFLVVHYADGPPDRVEVTEGSIDVLAEDVQSRVRSWQRQTTGGTDVR